MKLYCFPVAPNPTKVRLYIAEKNASGASLAIEEVEVSLVDGAHKAPEFLKRSSLARLPLLEVEPGEYLTESLAIIEYLEELHPEPPMIGEHPFERARRRSLERVIDLDVLGSIARYVHATNSPLGLPPSAEVAAHALQRLPGALNLLEELLDDGRTFLDGDHVTVSDCTLAAALQFGRFGGFEIEQTYRNVLAWDAAYRAREVARSVLLV